MHTLQRLSLWSMSFFLIASLYSSLSVAAEKAALSDQAITLAVQAELAMDRTIAGHQVNVETRQGVVVLDGQVDHLLARERATQRVTRVKGVRAVVNNLHVKTPVRRDQELLHDVQQALLLDPATDAYELRVQVNDGKVTLQGMVDSWQEKHLSEQVAKSVQGVKQVQNDIAIAYTTRRSDQELQEEISRRLAADVWVDAGLITVAVQDGHVILQGTVGSAAEKTRAAMDALVMGVQSVDESGVQVDWRKREAMRRVTPLAPKTDQEITRAASAALQYDPRLKGMSVQVAVARGMATLTGTVDNLAAKTAAEQDVNNTVGVWHVENNLRVLPSKLPESVEMIRDVRAALVRDPYLDRYGIEVTALKGQVFLSGTVQSSYEKDRAGDVAARVPGVVEVVNTLRVLATRQSQSDVEILTSIQQKLQQSAVIDSEDIHVSVEGGVATVSGVVDNRLERDAVITTAYEGGAHHVHNALQVQWQES